MGSKSDCKAELEQAAVQLPLIELLQHTLFLSRTSVEFLL